MEMIHSRFSRGKATCVHEEEEEEEVSGDLTGWLEKENPSHAYRVLLENACFTQLAHVFPISFFFFIEVKNCHFATSYSVENLKTFEFCEEANSPKTLHAFKHNFVTEVSANPLSVLFPFGVRMAARVMMTSFLPSRPSSSSSSDHHAKCDAEFVPPE